MTVIAESCAARNGKLWLARELAETNVPGLAPVLMLAMEGRRGGGAKDLGKVRRPEKAVSLQKGKATRIHERKSVMHPSRMGSTVEPFRFYFSKKQKKKVFLKQKYCTRDRCIVDFSAPPNAKTSRTSIVLLFWSARFTACAKRTLSLFFIHAKKEREIEREKAERERQNCGRFNY